MIHNYYFILSTDSHFEIITEIPLILRLQTLKHQLKMKTQGIAAN